MPDSSNIDELPPLTDEDIDILFNIVSLAQQSPHPPFRALFSAYDLVLAEHGIAPEHDQRFFRYLLRLGEGPTTATNRNLVLRFRKLLARLDIHIVIDDDNDEDLTDGLKQEEKIRVGDGGRRSRRASFNDTMLDESWVSEGRLQAVDAQQSPHTSLDELLRLKRPPAPTPESAHITAPAAHPPRGRIDAKPLPSVRSRSLSTQGSLRISRNYSRDRAVGLYRHPEGPLSDSASDVPSSPPVHHPSRAFSPSDHEISETEDLTSEADAFHHTSLIRTARQCLHRMHHQTVRLYDLQRVAQNHDHRLLKAQALSIWASKIFEIRQAAETERFFEHYERRATRARDLFLLNKAFTHWAQCTSEEVERTSTVKRHILRTRYFNAWSDITAVNELKCRKLGLRKWLSLWRAKTAHKLVDNERAVAIYEENLVRRIYWKWFWEFCERKAPVWHDYRLTEGCVKRLQDAVERYRQHGAAAERIRNINLLRKTFGRWSARWRAGNTLDQSAVRHHRHSLLGNCLHELHHESKLGNASKQLSQSISRRLLSQSLFIWRQNTHLAQQATAFNRQNLLQHAWRNWNDNLRSQALMARIDDRILLENLYKWILQARLALFKRVQDTRLQQQALQLMSYKLADRSFRLNEAAFMFQERQRRRILASTMLMFHGKSRVEEMQDRQAMEFRNARALDKMWPIWKTRAQHLSKLDQWSVNARFYCLTTDALRRWKEATIQSKRNRRREAYITVRRRVKTAMVRNCFHTWRQKANLIRQMDDEATVHAEERFINFGTDAFILWLAKARRVLTASLEAETRYARLLLQQSISALTTKGQEVLQHDAQALALRSQTTEVLATETLKKLKWALFCLKRSQDSAVALEQRNAEQHRRNMLKYWAETALRRRALKALPPPDPDSPTKPPNLFSSLRLPSTRKTPSSEDWEAPEMDFGATARAEEWTQFEFFKDLPVLDEDAPYSSHATPLPGYMRTPSKRTARARRSKAVAASVPRETLITTTPAPLRGMPGLEALTPQVTPFERKMRAGGYGGDEAGVSTTPATFRRTRFGRSGFGGLGAGGFTGRSVRFFDADGFDGKDESVDVGKTVEEGDE